MPPTLAPMKINSCKNDKNGAATVKWAVSSGTNKANGYELQYAESKEDLFGQKGTFRKASLNGRNSLSKTVTGLKKGKTYYISIRVRKKVNGIDYYTTFGVPVRITVTK